MSTRLQRKREDEIIPLIEVDEMPRLKIFLAEADAAFERQRINLNALHPTSVPEALEGLDAYFLAWREATLRRDYLQKTQGDMRVPTESGMLAYVANAGQEYNCHGLPSAAHFRQHIFPTVLTLAKGEVSKLIRIGLDALGALECLMASELSSFRFRTAPQLLVDFFSDDSAEMQEDLVGAQGQFRHYYSKYGPSFVKAVAIHQGWESDRYYGGGDYTNSRAEIDRRFLPYYDKLPAIYRDRIFDGFISYEGRQSAWRFLELATQEITTFLEREKAHLLPYYLALLEERPKIYEPPVKQSELLLPVDELILELEALHQMGQWRDLALSHARMTVTHTMGLGAYQGLSHRVPLADRPLHLPHISFRDVGQTGESMDGIYRPKALILEWQAAGYSNEKIADILALPERYPWLKMNAFQIFSAYIKLDQDFPDGLRGFIGYLEQIRQSERCLDHFIASACQGRLPNQPYLQRYCQLGVELVNRFGDGAATYFFLIKGYGVFRLMEASSHPDDFDKHIRAASDLASSLQSGGKSQHQGQESVFEACLENFDRPDFIEGLATIIDAANQNSDGKNVEESSPDPFIIAILHYGRLDSTMSSQVIDYPQVAKMLCYLARGGDADSFCWHFIVQLQKGLSPQTALLFTLAEKGLVHGDSDDLKAIGVRIEPAELNGILEQITTARKSVAQCLDPSSFDSSGESDLCKLADKKVVALKAQEMALVALAADPKMAGISIGPVVDSVRSALRFVTLRAILTASKAPALAQRPEAIESGLLTATNPNTRMTMLTMAVLVAAGVVHMPGVSEKLSPLPYDFATGPSSETIGTILSDPKWADRMRGNTTLVLPAIEASILGARTKVLGLMPVGGKIHTTKPMDGRIFKAILDFFGLESTPFRLIHADGSLLLPASVSALELQWLIHILEQFGVIQSDRPEIQVSVGDRLTPQLAALVGSATLLATQRGVIYDPTAFSTTDDGLTGKRMMAYDAGVRQTGLPFDLNQAKGRTDILGRRHYGDIDTYRVLATLATHLQHGARFAPLAHDFFHRYVQILAARGLKDQLDRSAWVFDHAAPGDSDAAHYDMVNAFGRAWMHDSQVPGHGVIGRVHGLIAGIVARIQAQREGIIAHHPNDYQRILTY